MSVGSQSRGISAETAEMVYRPISKAAAFEFGLAILSALAFASPLAWPFPVIILIAAATTSAWLERNRIEYAGQVLAKLAIFISLIFAVGAPTKYFVERYLIVEEAINANNVFLDLVLANQVKEAYVYTLAPVQKAGMENKIDDLIVRSGQNYREYLNWDIIIKLRGKLQKAQVTCLGLASREDKPGHDLTLQERMLDWIEGSNYVYANGAYQVALRYRITMDDGTVFEIVSIAVGGTGDWKGRQWHLAKVSIVTVV